MPRRQRAAESSLVTVLPAKDTWPLLGARSPEMRPNRLVLPAPFGPTIPTLSPGPTANDRSSAMTTRPNRFVTGFSSSSSGSVIRSFLRPLTPSPHPNLQHQPIVSYPPPPPLPPLP